MAEPTLYERLGGIFAIAAVIDSFSDRLLKNPKIVDANPELHEWHTMTYHTGRTRPPGSARRGIRARRGRRAGCSARPASRSDASAGGQGS
jgi:hypothetical protein